MHRVPGTFLLALAVLCAGLALPLQAVVLLNVSYDPTREFYKQVNTDFAAQFRKNTGQDLRVQVSHGGSGKQARAVIDGLEADVVTLALSADIDAIASRAGLLPANWQARLPNNSCPYRSTIVLLVRAGNPKNIRDWDDLIRPDVSVVTPNPKTSGGARWNYLAAWTYAASKYQGDEVATRNFMARLYANVPVLDTGARGATTTFVNRGIGDVLIAWENEAFLARGERAGAGLELIMPSISMLAEPSVALVDKNVDRHGNRAAAQAYLEFLYSARGQALAAQFHFRPSKPELVPAAALAKFRPVLTVTVQEAFGGWKSALAVHFADGGLFDQIYKPAR